MIKYFHLVLISTLILFINVITAQQSGINRHLNIKEVSGQESESANHSYIINANPEQLIIPDVSIADLTFSFHPINYFSGYDYQSNGVPQEIWQDPNNPAYVNSIMMYSDEPTNWADRTCRYFRSSDFGNTWAATGFVPPTGERSGYPSISGMPDGRQVIADHDFAGGVVTYTKIYVATAPGSDTYLAYDPGTVVYGEPIWPRLCVVNSDNIIIAASINQPPIDNAFTINLNPITGVFSDWTPYEGTQAESYSLAVSEDSSQTGHLYISNDSNFGDLFYRVSSDGGYTWDVPVKIWDWNDTDSLGCFRGIDLIFLNNQPCAVFEIDKISVNDYFPSFPSKIYFWSPGVNEGIPTPIAESGINIPYHIQYDASNDFFTPVCRPTIGRSSSGQSLFVAFSAVTGDVFGDTSAGLANSYYAGYFTYSVNAGQSWTQPVKFTPDSPLRDWRYISISPTNNVTGEDCLVQMFIQSDSIPGSNVNAPVGYPVSVTSQMVGVTAEITGIIPVELLNFKAEYIDDRIQLIWQTATEKNNLGFKVLRSENAQDWKEIGFVHGNGTTTKPHSYQYTDENIANGKVYYRLKQIDFDGTYCLLKIVSLDANIPNEMKLLQNYPNPFNPTTKIKYTIPDNGRVKLEIYNTLGQKVYEIINQEAEAGSYEVNFTANDLSSGIYYYKITFNGYSDVKKMVLLK